MDAARAIDLQRYVQNGLEGHRTVWRISENEYLESSLERIVLPSCSAQCALTDRDTFSLLEDAQTHMPLMTALESGQSAVARAQLLKGMDDWLEGVRTFALEGEHDYR